MSLLDQIDGPEQLKKLSVKDLKELADEIRDEIIQSVSQTGGHLASSLGVVEITLAWHYVFSSPQDKVIWDVGHQTYAHKLITGRKDRFCTLRQMDGLSGFPKRCESEHDAFETGHSATSISAALGMTEANKLHHRHYNTTAIIGDGALTGGMALEAINHAGHLQSNVLVILNDNEMSIDSNVGALSNYLDRVRTGSTYLKTKRGLSSWIEKIPFWGPSWKRGLEKIKDGFKYFFITGIFFEELGFTYLGPIDGHDLESLIEHLHRIKSLEGPVILHILTQKGRGYAPAIENPELFHGISSFNISDGSSKNHSRRTFTQCFSDNIVRLGDENKEIVAITAAMAKGTGLDYFQEKFPERFFDVAIAEQHAVTFAAGLAAAGMRPVVAIYATFMQRAIDQVIHDVCRQSLPVVFCVDRSGLVGEDGGTHQGIFDLGMFYAIPHLDILLPSDEEDMHMMLNEAMQSDKPVMIRYPRDVIPERIHAAKEISSDINWIQKGSDLLIISASNTMTDCVKAMEKLNMLQMPVGLLGLRKLKPFPTKSIVEIIESYKTVLVVEENCRSNGLGSIIAQEVHCQIPIEILALPDEFIEHGSQQALRKKYGLDAEGIVGKVMELYQGQ